MGYPTDYTAFLVTEDKKDTRTMRHRRHTLLGKAWSLHVTYFIAQALIVRFASATASGDSLSLSMSPGAFRWGRENCPYVQQLSLSSSCLPKSLPPDWVEQHAYAASSLAASAVMTDCCAMVAASRASLSLDLLLPPLHGSLFLSRCLSCPGLRVL